MNVIFPPEPEVVEESLTSEMIGRGGRWARFWVPNILRQLLQCALVALMAYGSYLFDTTCVMETVDVVGVSMLPTLRNNDHYLLNRWAYLFREPKPNDIVVLRDPTDNSFAVKRIMGHEGDSIYLKSGRVYLNGKLLEEPYLEPGTPTYSFVTKQGDEMFTCGQNRYFVMGDNRKNSMDSRIYGPVPRENLLGTVLR